jgi:GntR family transcriptional regulator, carbon starvation induced regulator
MVTIHKLDIRRSPATDSPEADAGRTQGERAYLALYQAIVAGRFAPGLPLRPEELKDEFGFGVSPVREALLRLTADGLVRLEGHRGFQLPVASVEELLDIARVRCELGVMALRWSIERGNDDWEALVVATFHRLDKVARLMASDPTLYAAEHESRNRDFHMALESASGSPLLQDFGHKAFSRSERYRRHFVDYTQIVPNAHQEHKDMMDAALRRDAATACDILRDHILNNVQVVREALERRLGTHPR